MNDENSDKDQDKNKFPPLRKLPPCQVCGRPAFVQFTEVRGNEKKTSWLCKEHAQEKGILLGGPPDPGKMGMPGFQFSLPEILSSFAEMSLREDSEQDHQRCAACGTSLSDFKKTGRLGCPQCYRSFGSILLPLIRRVQRSIHHMGQAPARLKQHLANARRLEELRGSLQKAVKEERYEDAAEYRDKIRALERESAS